MIVAANNQHSRKVSYPKRYPSRFFHQLWFALYCSFVSGKSALLVLEEVVYIAERFDGMMLQAPFPTWSGTIVVLLLSCRWGAKLHDNILITRRGKWIFVVQNVKFIPFRGRVFALRDHAIGDIFSIAREFGAGTHWSGPVQIAQTDAHCPPYWTYR